MDQLSTESNFDIDLLLNFEFPTATATSSYTNNQASPSDLVPMDSMFSFEKWDLSLLPSIPSMYQSIEVTPSISWPSSVQNKTELLLTQGFQNGAAPFPSHESWSPASSSSSNESDITPKIRPAQIPNPRSSGDEEVSPRRTVRRTKKTKVEKAERLERRREKNRTSQRKFRERKEHYIQELERQCSDLQKRCDSLLYLLSDQDPGFREKEQWNWPELTATEV